MIYLVSTQKEIFKSDTYTLIDVQESLNIIKDWSMCQFDTETSGRDAHINDFKCMQFGNIDKTIQIIIDVATVSPLEYKDFLEHSFLIGQNLKFDLQFLYKYNIIPLRVYDTMITEQLLYLGFPYIKVKPSEYITYNYDFPYLTEYSKDQELLYSVSFSLKALVWKYFKKEMDKTVRGEIIWRGLDDKVIIYSANDVVDLYDIMCLQIKECRKKDILKGLELECNFVPAIAYLEWCGIKLDINKWQAKMEMDRVNYKEAVNSLNEYAQSNPKLKQFTYIDYQGDLFTGYDTSLKCKIDWGSSKQVSKVAKILGFNTTVIDKKTGEEKDSVIEKQLKGQKGIDDKFLELYFKHQEYHKVCTSFGQNHINSVNPLTNRIHTNYKQLGCASGRMSCGSKQINTDLAKLKHLPINPSAKQKREGLVCSYPNIQQLPADEVTRSAFVANDNNLLADCDYSALESRLGADIYNEQSMINEFLHGSGDMHSLCAKMVFKNELKDIPVKEIKSKRPDLRKKVKCIEFSQQFGGTEYSIAASLGCDIKDALDFKIAYENGFKGVKTFKEKGAKFVKTNGYVLMNKITGHKMYWWDFKKWKKENESYTYEFWQDYKVNHKPVKDEVYKAVKAHFKASSYWERMALNAPTQGTGCNIIKLAATNLFKWILDNNLFNKVLLCAMVHDELLVEFPKELKDTFPKILEDIMLNAAKVYCKKLPIPAEAEISTHWVH